MINYSHDSKDTNLASIGFSDESEDRKTWIAESRIFDMCGPIQFDFFDQPKYLIPGVNVHIRLHRNKTGFSLNTASVENAPIIKLLEAKLYIRRVKVEPSVLIGHTIGLNTKNAIYPIRQTRLVTFSIATSSTNFYKDQIFGDYRLPKFVLITFQNSTKHSGTFTENCVEFDHLNVNSLTLSRDTDYRETYTQDFTKNNFMRTYVQSILRNLGQLEKNFNYGISPADFKKKCPFFTFVLAPDFDIHQSQLPRSGNLQLDIKFDTALSAPANIIIYGVFDSEIQINKTRNIFH
jgi:hypothetical protein